MMFGNVRRSERTGGWGWLAEECGLPIAAAIADALTKE